MIFWSGLKSDYMFTEMNSIQELLKSLLYLMAGVFSLVSDAVSDVEMQEHYDEFFEVGGHSSKVMLKWRERQACPQHPEYI